MASYSVKLIDQIQKEKILESLKGVPLFEKKATLHGTCVKFFTDSADFKEMWEENFEAMPEWVRPHVRIYSLAGKKLEVLFEVETKTVIIKGCDYYGWVKSIALALAADFFEDFPSEHQRNSVHGSFVDKGGKGLAIIGPSGSGKTTLTYGLFMKEGYNFLTDDWFFVRFASNDTLVYSSEKNSYIRGDLGSVWDIYAKRLNGIKRDSKDRAVVDVGRLIGKDRIRQTSNLIGSVLLTRNPKLPPLSSLTPKEAIEFQLKNDFCNPHQLVRSKKKLEHRKKFFMDLFSRAPVYLLNTIETPAKTLERLESLFKA